VTAFSTADPAAGGVFRAHPGRHGQPHRDRERRALVQEDGSDALSGALLDLLERQYGTHPH
jgi:hypothetical protein